MLRIKRPVEEHFVFLFNFVPRMCQTLRQRAIVGEQNQSLAVLVEPADMKEPSKMRRHKVENGRSVSFHRTVCTEALWLVQEDVNRRRGTGRWFSGDAHVVARLHDRGEIANEMTVDRNLAVLDQRFTGAPRSESLRQARKRFNRISARSQAKRRVSSASDSRLAQPCLIFGLRFWQANHASGRP